MIYRSEPLFRPFGENYAFAAGLNAGSLEDMERVLEHNRMLFALEGKEPATDFAPVLNTQTNEFYQYYWSTKSMRLIDPKSDFAKL